jgi:thymidylate synthase ThyX
MKISAKVIADSISNNVRLSTLQLKAPKFLDAEFEKHRMLSSNSSSDRAIPLNTLLERPYYLPTDVRLNQSGMQGNNVMTDDEVAEFHEALIDLHGYTAKILTKWNHVHKQHLNRYLLGYSWQDKVVTATEFDNFFALRDHHAAQPEIQELAQIMKRAMAESTPTELKHGQWHLPYLTAGEYQELGMYYGTDKDLTEVYKKVSSARCGRVSYMNHDNSDPDIQKDLELFDMLATRPYDNGTLKLGVDEPVHLSTTEHQATPMDVGYRSWDKWHKIPGITHMDKHGMFWSGNLRGFIQHRQLI